MKTKYSSSILTALLGAALTANVAAQTNAITYQGRLTDGGSPANGLFDFSFELFTDASAGSSWAAATNTAVVVSNGLFTVQIDVGPGVFGGTDLWLEIGAVTNGGGAFTILGPRQPITAAPLALFAANAASVAAVDIVGSLQAAQLPASVITNGASNVSISGMFSGDGSGVTGVALTNINSDGVIFMTTNTALYSTSSSPGTGTGPISVASVDVNSDGWPDLVSANFNAHTLSVLTNNGTGSFAPASSPGVGTGPYSVTSADVNGDGWPDLVSANFNAYTLSVLTNNGTGGFALASSPGVGTSPASVASADVNGDGWPDLVSANYNAHTLSVLTNNGTGGFALASSPGVGTGPYSVTSADVNGDGWPDLVSANYFSHTLSILTNNGTGGFALASSPAVGTYPVSVASADVNGDGWADLVSANLNDNTLSVLTNNGTGSFALASSPSVGSGPRSVTPADVNGDGWPDLVSANYSSQTLSVLTNTGTGGFVLSSSPSVGTGPYSVTSTDVNGDGLMDLVSANYSADTLTVVTNSTRVKTRFVGDGSGLENVYRLGAADGEPSIAVYVDDAGRVGIGTTTPAAEIGNTALRVANTGHVVVNNNYGFFSVADGGGIGAGMDTGADDSLNFYSGSSSGRLVIQAGGNVGIGTSSPIEKLHVAGSIYASGTITPSSDRNLKKNFDPVDAAAVLERVVKLPIQRWTYKTEDDAVRHVGPMAQDFYAAFGLGANEISIATVDADGVALAAIQGLNQKLERENAELRQRLDRLERLLKALPTGDEQ